MGQEGARLRSKVISMEQAAAMVTDGMSVAIGGVHSHNAPCAFVRELARAGTKNLTVIPSNAAGYQVDLLIGVGAVKTLYNSYCGLDYLGAAPHFRREAESGRLDVLEFEEMGLLRGLKAAEGGVAFFPLPDGMLAVDVIRANPEFYKTVKDPFSGREIVVARPIKADVCVIHVAKCDLRGNAIEYGMPDPLHKAAHKVIVTTDEIVPPSYIEAHHYEVSVLGQFVDAVVKAPYGAHPGESAGKYTHDEQHLRAYQEAGKDEKSFKGYLDRYVIGKTNEQYLREVGIDRLLELNYY